MYWFSIFSVLVHLFFFLISLTRFFKYEYILNLILKKFLIIKVVELNFKLKITLSLNK